MDINKPRRSKKLPKKLADTIPKVPLGAIKRPGSTPDKPTENGPVPQITNESIAAHREEVLGSARKYIYPLRHSRHRVVKISITLFVLAIIIFFVACTIALYKMQTTSAFMHSVTKIVPFPVAKAGDRYVSYDSYLFELRRYTHYYESQQGLKISSEDGQRQLASFKERSLDKAIAQAYVKQLAAERNITVSNKEVNDQVAMVRKQNRLGSSDEVFRNVLREFWGWSVSDFKRELKNELLEQKVIAVLDKDTNKRAQDALNQLKAGADFAAVASQVSDDAATKANGGEYGFTIDRSSRDIAPQAVDALYKLKVGQYTDIINSGYYLEINKLLEVNGEKLRASHMTFNFADINEYLEPIKKEKPTQRYLEL